VIWVVPPAFAAADLPAGGFVDEHRRRLVHPAQRVGDAVARHQVDEGGLLQRDRQCLLDGP
jgi:hypothetical protein